MTRVMRSLVLVGFLLTLFLAVPAAACPRCGYFPAADEAGDEHKAEDKETEEDIEARPAPGSWDVDMPLGEAMDIAFTTDEGTWMSLDVHPDGQHLVFDMLGDLYLLPLGGGEAKPLTRGAGYDMQPRFSPDGKTLLFASDRGGTFNLWLADFADGELKNERAFTEESGHHIEGGFWDPSGEWIYARKRFMDTSSIGVSELWSYHIKGGAGLSLVGADKAGEVDFFSATSDERFLYFGASAPFRYERNPHTSIWSIRRLDRKNGQVTTVNSGYGSSASPLLSPDETRLAFIRRQDQKTTLWIHNLESGREEQVWDNLDRDQIAGFGTHGVYPMYDWLPDGNGLVVWAQGKLWRLQEEGQSWRAAHLPFTAAVDAVAHHPLRQPRSPVQDQVQARLLRWPTFAPDNDALVFSAMGHLYTLEKGSAVPKRLTTLEAFEFGPAFSPDGRYLAFTTWEDERGGSLVILDRRRGRLSTRYRHGAQLINPSFSPDGRKLVFLQGSGTTLRGSDLGWEGSFELMEISFSGAAAPRRITSVPSRWSSRPMPRPRYSADGRRVFFIQSEEGSGGGPRGRRQPEKTVLVSVNLDGTDLRKHVRSKYAFEIIMHPSLKYVAVAEQHNAYIYRYTENGQTLDLGPGGSAVPFAQLSLDGGEWVDFSADGNTVSWSFGTKIHRAEVADLNWSDKAPKRSKEDRAEVFEVALSAADKYTFAEETFDLEALKEKLLAGLGEKVTARVELSIASGASWQAFDELKTWCGKAGLGFKVVKEEKKGDDEKTGGEENKEEDPLKLKAETFEVDLQLPRAVPQGTIVLDGARLITMRGHEVIGNGRVVVKNDRIAALGPASEVNIPEGARVVDVSGKTIIPGLIDVHAHMGYGVLDITPQKEWRYFANLAYGVTTTHDPSASSHTVFGQGPMVEAGLMVGPRIFSTGYILYGATSPGMAVINSYEDALSHLRRLKAMGAFSVKSYMQPRRDQRQWVIQAALEENMLVFPEGGGDFETNIGMVLDGHSGIEHNLSLANLYQDAVELFAKTRSGITPTLLVSYGGQSGENWFYQHFEVWKNQKLQSFHPPGMIDARARRRQMSAEDDFHHPRVAAHLKKVVEAGGLVNLGGHGQLQGLGPHWELWALTHGGMGNHDALRCATINGATYLGMDQDLGSLEVGKLADLAILDANPLDNIENSAEVDMTMINGYLYEAETMDRVWPSKKPRGKFHFQR